MRVEVYFNLHKRLFSVRALEGPNKGKVVHHARSVVLEGVSFKVSEAGRQRVLREKRKNVHAFVRGTLKAIDRDQREPLIDLFGRLGTITSTVTYNPFKRGTFYRSWSSEEAFMNAGVYAANHAFLWVNEDRRSKILVDEE